MGLLAVKCHVSPIALFVKAASIQTRTKTKFLIKGLCTAWNTKERKNGA